MDKRKIANFLDLTDDFLCSGYRRERKEINFDEKPCATVEMNESKIDKTNAIEEIAARIKKCSNCQLAANRKNAVPGEGVLQPLVMVIGEGPGADEDARGRPFVGRAGQLLDKMLASIDLSRDVNCFIANVVKCRPPGNRDPYPEETAACSGFLMTQIAALKPGFILIAGRVAAQSVLNTTESVSNLRGRELALNVDGASYPVLVTYHPAALLRSENLKRPAWEDLKLLRGKLQSTASFMTTEA